MTAETDLPLPKVLTLLEKATPGEWEADGDDANYHEITICGNDRYACSVGIWQLPRAMGLHDEPERVANAAAIVAAVNYLRTHGANLAELQREVEALRAEVRYWQECGEKLDDKRIEAEARAERLAEALREIAHAEEGDSLIGQIARAALDQETTNG